jgi:hypothetical protein|tara:strand:+ start:1238 stop:1432 length:195 start_codon:yes stop_codon:yes gene_type:complete
MSNVRLEKIEWTLERHDVLIQTSIKSLASINANLQQMKWFGIGAVVVVVANQFGLSTFLRLIGI